MSPISFAFIRSSPRTHIRSRSVRFRLMWCSSRLYATSFDRVSSLFHKIMHVLHNFLLYIFVLALFSPRSSMIRVWRGRLMSGVIKGTLITTSMTIWNLTNCAHVMLIRLLTYHWVLLLLPSPSKVNILLVDLLQILSIFHVVWIVPWCLSTILRHRVWLIIVWANESARLNIPSDHFVGALAIEKRRKLPLIPELGPVKLKSLITAFFIS